MDEHGVLDRLVREHVADGAPVLPLAVHRFRRPAGDVEPDRLTRRREGRMRHGEAERLGDDLRGRRRAEELAAASRRGAGAAAEIGCVLERDEPVGEPRPEGLHGARVLAARRRQRDAAGHDGARQLPERGDRHEHRRQPLVAGSDADDAAPARQRADEPPEDERGVVAIGERVEHPGRALRAAVARVGDMRGERQSAQAV